MDPSNGSERLRRTALGFILAPFGGAAVLGLRAALQHREIPSILPLVVALLFMYVVQGVIALPAHFALQGLGVTSLSAYLALGALLALTGIVFSLPHPSLGLADGLWLLSVGWTVAAIFWSIAVWNREAISR